MGSIFRSIGSDGRAVGHVQPVADSVAGSPFTSGVGSASTPKLTGLAVLVARTQPIHVRFDKDVAVAADANDFLLPIGVIFMVPCDGTIISFIQSSSGAGDLFVEMAREV